MPDRGCKCKDERRELYLNDLMSNMKVAANKGFSQKQSFYLGLALTGQPPSSTTCRCARSRGPHKDAWLREAGNA